MADEPVDLEQTRRIDELTARLERLGSALAASPVVGASVRDLFPAAGPRAWPAGVFDGDVITATHINAISASVRVWEGDVNGNNNLLVNARGISVGMPSAPLGLMHLNAGDAGGIDAVTGIVLDRLYGAVGDSMDIVWGGPPTRMARISANAVAGGEGALIFYAQTGAGDGYVNEVMRIEGRRIVHLRPPVLTGLATGRGSICINEFQADPGGPGGIEWHVRGDGPGGGCRVMAVGPGCDLQLQTRLATPWTARAVFAGDGAIRLNFGGVMKTLSVDASGFVKAA